MGRVGARAHSVRAKYTRLLSSSSSLNCKAEELDCKAEELDSKAEHWNAKLKSWTVTGTSVVGRVGARADTVRPEHPGESVGHDGNDGDPQRTFGHLPSQV